MESMSFGCITEKKCWFLDSWWKVWNTIHTFSSLSIKRKKNVLINIFNCRATCEYYRYLKTWDWEEFKISIIHWLNMQLKNGQREYKCHNEEWKTFSCR